MTYLSWSSILTLGMSLNLAAQAMHQIDAQGSYLPAGRPHHPAKILAVGGKPVEFRWEMTEQAEAPTVQVDRITDTRRLPLTTATPSFSGTTYSFLWKVPATRGVALYEIQLGSRPETVFRIETRNADWMKKSISALSRMQWESSALGTDELRALRSLGISAVPARDETDTAFLRMVPPQAKLGRRHVKWSDDDPDSLVWQSGPAMGDLRIQAPRWWLSPQALSTDQGIIRLLDLFLQTPANP